MQVFNAGNHHLSQAVRCCGRVSSNSADLKIAFCVEVQIACLLLHDGRCAGEAMPLQNAIDATPTGEDSCSNTLCSKRHRGSILTPQLLHQLCKLNAQRGPIPVCGGCWATWINPSAVSSASFGTSPAPSEKCAQAARNQGEPFAGQTASLL